MEKEEIKKIVLENTLKEENIKIIVLKTIKEYSKSGAFIDRKTTDTPIDTFSPVNRKFVTLNGATTSRPVSSVVVVGQRYFDTTINKPIYYTTAGWRDATSSIVAQNN